MAERRMTNGSIYIELAHLSAGQRFLLELPDPAAARRRAGGPGHGDRRAGRHLQPGDRVDAERAGRPMA